MSIFSLLDESDQFLSESQEYLLGALLKNGLQSESHAKMWSQTVKFDELDASSYRLIPALYAKCGKTDALKNYSGRMKGIYRYYFYRNNRLIVRIRETLAALLKHDVDFIVFKGTSIVTQYHKSVALRSFGDCDVLIRKKDLIRAGNALRDAGWTYRYDEYRWQTDTHSHDYVDEEAAGFDLHWYALFECCEDGIDDGFWRRSRELDWKGLKLRVLSPEDEILVAACNGIRDRQNVRVDWLYDADLIFKSTPDFDWGLFKDEARARNLSDYLVAPMALLDRYVPGFPAIEVEQRFHPEICRALARMLAENRNLNFDLQMRNRIQSMVRPQNPLRKLLDYSLNTDWIARAASARNTLKYIRYDLNDDGWICRLRLHKDLLAVIPDVFEVLDPAAYERLAIYMSTVGEVLIEAESDVIRVPDDARFKNYRATISIDQSRVSFEGPQARRIRIRARITNTSPVPWIVYPHRRNLVGLSYHLMDEQGNVIEWNMPRLYFLNHRRHHATVLLPGSCLDVELDLKRPPSVGIFYANFDIVHEHVRWFASPELKFPSLEISVS